MEFLVRIEVNLPPDMDPTARQALLDRESARGRELHEAGTIVRIWRLPGRLANVGVWQAADATALHAALSSLPVFNWTRIEVTALATHYLEQDAGPAQSPTDGGR
jgi:muconolactone D-isomerase